MTHRSGDSAEHASAASRQKVVRVAGRRRAQLTPVPGAIPETAVRNDTAAENNVSTAVGPNDERLRREVPPHY
ncbi:hypothetical protein [Microbacterium sp. YY-01]|uniref:hypothetical protein n=1 Tax=Microbacterium sp. YY-01 TaxID=3421634 RepID=UPI003D17C08B